MTAPKVRKILSRLGGKMSEIFIKFYLNFFVKNQNLERRNVERPIFRNIKITNIKITKDELFDSFICEFIFLIFVNYLNNLIIFQIGKY